METKKLAVYLLWVGLAGIILGLLLSDSVIAWYLTLGGIHGLSSNTIEITKVLLRVYSAIMSAFVMLMITVIIYLVHNLFSTKN